MNIERSSAILLHITSLPSIYGIGDMGEAAYQFVDFLQESGHSFWQILPLNPTEATFSHSPYSSHSAFAGNPMLISPDLLVEEGLLSQKDLAKIPVFDSQKVEFEKVNTFKKDLLDIAYLNFSKSGNTYLAGFSQFCHQNQDWLDDYTLFLTIKGKYPINWTQWDKSLRDRDAAALEAFSIQMKEEIKKEKFIQFLFFSQWLRLKAFAHEKGIGFIGDIPFYINHDSADCWAHWAYFKLDKDKLPTKISGVPPDYFSDTGQLWGTPVFKWKPLEKNGFDWWIKRLGQNLLLYDFVRLDHFRAFAAYWEVPAGDETAINGKWVESPGIEFFKTVETKFPDMPFIAEDLGYMDDPVFELLEKFNFPGMKVLQFAFGEGIGENPYILHNHSKNSVVFTGTHDNNTTLGWFHNSSREERRNFYDYTGAKPTSKNIAWKMHQMALMSVSDLAIIPMQDIVGLDENAKMNRPGTSEGNWTWRLLASQLPWESVEDLKKINIRYGRWKKEKA
ncbi:MAG: 4-alpha-glucanotransferase [Cyclobacteriaceae bacterium]